MELVITGYAGESGSREIFADEETRKKLLGLYPQSFFDVWKNGETGTPFPDPVRSVTDRECCADGGVYGALWRLLKRNGLGASFSQRLIPVRQQTIEICETEGLDPYRLSSKDCVIWLCEDTWPVREYFPSASVFGTTCPGPAIRRIDGETVSFLRRPETAARDTEQ